MATLTGELISETYDSLLKVTDNNTITGIKKRITDGFGNDIPLLLSSTDLEIDGTLILSALTDLAPASKFLSLKVDNTVGFRTSSELLSDIGGASSSSISGTTGRLSKFTSSGTVGNSILEEIGNAIHLTNAGSSFASFGINNPGIDNDCFIGSTINNDFLIKINNVEALRIDTALRLKIATIQNALGDTDKFLVSEDGVVKYRTGDELRADIGAGVGSVTSVGLSMPVAFSVANSPITSSGTLAVTAVGTASQYIRGDGQLATLPTGAGGGSAVNYYLNGSVNASVATYKQMSNSAVIGAGTDFNLVGNGLVAQFLTDVNNPNRLLIPGGAWNLEMFFSVSSAGGNQKFYVDLLKYNGTTFSLIATTSGNPEEITGGTSTDLYLTSIAVQETVLLTTDRLAIRVYIVDNAVGRTVTLHTENGNLCQIITTFAGGISALNGLTANTQYLAVGTSGTDFAISSLTDTHTFNLPTASATNRGALSSANWSTFNNKQNAITLTTTGSSGAATLIGATLNIPNYGSALSGYVPYTGATFAVNLGAFNLTVNGITVGRGGGSVDGNTAVGFQSLFSNTIGSDNVAIGYNSLISNISGNGNVAVGSGSLFSNTTGLYNTAIGVIAGYLTTSGATNQSSSNSIYLGYGTRASANGNTNEIVIGFNSFGGGSNSATLGNTSIATTILHGNTSIGYTTNPSLYKLDVNGTGRFSGNLTTNGILIGRTSNGQAFGVGNGIDSDLGIFVQTGNIAFSNSGTASGFSFALGGSTRFSIASTGAATFSNNVTVGNGTGSVSLAINRNSSSGANGLRFQTAATNNWFLGSGATGSNTNLEFYNHNTATSNLTLDYTTGAATFSSSVSVKTTDAAEGLIILGRSDDFGVLRFKNSAGSANKATIYTNPNNLVFDVGSTSSAMSITSGGNVGIGTTTPGKALEIYRAGSNTAQLKIGDASTIKGYLGIFSSSLYINAGGTFSGGWATDGTNGISGIVLEPFDGGAEIAFATSNSNTSPTERMRIKANGNLGIGTTTPSVKLQSNILTSGLPVTSGTTQTNGALRISSGATTGILDFGINGSNNWIQSTDSGDLSQGYNILLNPRGGNCLIGTTTDNGAKLQVNGNSYLIGDLLIGISPKFSNEKVSIQSTSSNVLLTTYNFSASAVTHHEIRNQNGIVGTIVASGGSTAYNTSSDYRLKQDLKEYNGIDLISKIKTYNYEWKSDNTRSFGVLAHELQEVIPNAVTGEKDAEQMQGVDYSKLVPVLIKAIQELNKKIIQLENK